MIEKKRHPEPQPLKELLVLARLLGLDLGLLPAWAPEHRPWLSRMSKPGRMLGPWGGEEMGGWDGLELERSFWKLLSGSKCRDAEVSRARGSRAHTPLGPLPALQRCLGTEATTE